MTQLGFNPESTYNFILTVYCYSQYSLSVSGQCRVSFHCVNIFLLVLYFYLCSKQMALAPVLDMLNHSATVEV